MLVEGSSNTTGGVGGGWVQTRQVLGGGGIKIEVKAIAFLPACLPLLLQSRCSGVECVSGSWGREGVVVGGEQRLPAAHGVECALVSRDGCVQGKGQFIGQCECVCVSV